MKTCISFRQAQETLKRVFICHFQCQIQIAAIQYRIQRVNVPPRRPIPVKTSVHALWQIQHFIDWSCQPMSLGWNLLFGQIFFWKLHENERNWTERRSVRLWPPYFLDPQVMLAFLCLGMVIVITDCCFLLVLHAKNIGASLRLNQKYLRFKIQWWLFTCKQCCSGNDCALVLGKGLW